MTQPVLRVLRLRRASLIRPLLLAPCIRPCSVLVARPPRRELDFRRLEWRQIRRVSMQAILLPPTVFLGLVVALWTWKCCMMVLFQNKIIYMPSVPPFARSESIDEYAATCRPIEWHEERIRAGDGTALSLCVSNLSKAALVATSRASDSRRKNKIILLYFQGNASSLPPRLPMLSLVLKSLGSSEMTASCRIVALSYRGFWKSSGRASEHGIRKDASAALEKTLQLATESDAKIILWGQSIGAGVAVDVLLRHMQTASTADQRIAGIILETPFTSVRNMLTALYPQKWLPYRYLWPFLWNKWDNEAAVWGLAAVKYRQPVLIVAAANDEVVPASHASQLADQLSRLGMPCQTVVVEHALHHETTLRPSGRRAIVGFVEQCSSRPSNGRITGLEAK